MPAGLSPGPQSPLTAANIRARLEGSTPTPVALVTATAVTVASWLVDNYGSRTGELVCTKSDGTRVSRRCTITHNGTSGADATTATISRHGQGSSADLNPATPWLDVDVNGATTAQVVRIRVTAAANGSDWTATFFPDFMRTP
jgi:hypothetical protein